MNLDDIQKVIESAVTKAVIEELKQFIAKSVQTTVQVELANLKKIIDSDVSTKVGKSITTFINDPAFGKKLTVSLEDSLKNNSIVWNNIKIPHEAVNFKGHIINADAIQGGTIKKFNSSGIEDQAKDIQLTVFDKGIVVENKILTRLLEVAETATVKKSMVVDGNLAVNGELILSAVSLNALGSKVLAQQLTQLSTATTNYKLPHTAIDFSTFKLNASQLDSGVIKNFTSTGIKDTAHTPQLIVADDNVQIAQRATINRLIVLSGGEINGTLQLNGSLAVSGDLIVDGTVSLNDSSFTALVSQASKNVGQTLDSKIPIIVADEIAKQLSAKTFDLGSVSVAGHQLLVGQKLANTITDTNIQKVGELKTLTVLGNAQLANVLTVQENKRIGINTDEPSFTFDLWDNDVQLAAYKIGNKNMFIGSSRDQIISLGTNGKVAVSITNDGTTIINTLRIGRNNVSFAASAPNHSGNQGDIVFNIEPAVGKPAGWQCGGGTKWFRFALTQE